MSITVLAVLRSALPSSINPMKKYAVLFSYVGTDFCGWQKQKGSAADGKPSIQLTIEAGLSKIPQEMVTIVESGGTDFGDHAVG